MMEKPEGMGEIKVWIFYSSSTEPELLTFYADGLAYLREQEIEMEVIDIAKEKEKAEKFEIKSTPTVLITENEEVIKRYQVVSYLRGILEREELEKIIGDL